MSARKKVTIVGAGMTGGDLTPDPSPEGRGERKRCQIARSRQGARCFALLSMTNRRFT